MVDDVSILGFDHIHINVPPDERDNARWFYGSVLGLRELAVPQAVISDSAPLCFQVGPAQELHLTFEPTTYNANGWGHLAWCVESIEALLERLNANGFDVHADGAAGPGERRRFFCRDPFGNRLEFAEAAVAEAREVA